MMLEKGSPVAVVWEYGRGFALLFLFAALGYRASHFSPIPFPPPLLGLALMGVALQVRLVRLEWIEAAGAYLLRHMSLFFLPILLGAAMQVPGSSRARLAVALATVGGTILTLRVTETLCSKWMKGEAS